MTLITRGGFPRAVPHTVMSTAYPTFTSWVCMKLFHPLMLLYLFTTYMLICTSTLSTIGIPESWGHGEQAIINFCSDEEDLRAHASSWQTALWATHPNQGNKPPRWQHIWWSQSTLRWQEVRGGPGLECGFTVSLNNASSLLLIFRRCWSWSSDEIMYILGYGLISLH
jgi:hypothetical protein